jgi:hypothetical protein
VTRQSGGPGHAAPADGFPHFRHGGQARHHRNWKQVTGFLNDPMLGNGLCSGSPMSCPHYSLRICWQRTDRVRSSCSVRLWEGSWWGEVGDSWSEVDS